MAYILHIDTSASIGTIALSMKGAMLRSKMLDDAKQQAMVINNVIEQLCADEGVSLQEIGAIAVVSEPGSYTGLRIGLATAKALCYALDIPLLMQDKLSLLSGALATQVDSEYDFYGAVLLAREGEYFFTIMGMQPPCHITIDDLGIFLNNLEGKACITGDTMQLTETDNRKLKPNNEINIGFWASSAHIAFTSKEFASIASAEPLYLKQVFIHQSKK